MKTMRRLGAERDALGVVFDQVGTPSYAAALSTAIVAILPLLTPGMKEVYHYSNEGVASWDCMVTPIESAAYTIKAVRPSYSVLSKIKIRTRFGPYLPHWTDGLRRCLRAMKA